MKTFRITNPPVTAFEPVPRRASSGGWSPRRQQGLIAALAGSVAQTAAAVGMSKTGVYLLRNAPGGDDFRRAWDAAIEDRVAVLKSVAFERAVDGVEATVHVDGKPVQTIHRYDNAMLLRLLAIYDTPERSAAGAAQATPKFSREQLTENFRKLVRRIAAEDAADDAKRAGETAAQAKAKALAALDLAPGDAPAFAPPMANRAVPVPRESSGAPGDVAPEARDEPGRWQRPQPPLPRIWTG